MSQTLCDVALQQAREALTALQLLPHPQSPLRITLYLLDSTLAGWRIDGLTPQGALVRTGRHARVVRNEMQERQLYAVLQARGYRQWHLTRDHVTDSPQEAN